MNNEDALRIRGEKNRVGSAELELSKTANDTEDHIEVIDLSVDRTVFPLKVQTDFIGIAVTDASDNAAVITVKNNSPKPGRTPWRLKQNGKRNYGKMNSAAYIFHAAQPGKTMELTFFKSGDFDSGQITSNNAGGFSINEGSSFTMSVVTLVAGAAPAILIPANASLKKAILQNSTGSRLWVGDASSDDGLADPTKRGIYVEDGEKFPWLNTSALYGFSAAGGPVVILTQL